MHRGNFSTVPQIDLSDLAQLLLALRVRMVLNSIRLNFAFFTFVPPPEQILDFRS